MIKECKKDHFTFIDLHDTPPGLTITVKVQSVKVQIVKVQIVCYLISILVSGVLLL